MRRLVLPVVLAASLCTPGPAIPQPVAAPAPTVLRLVEAPAQFSDPEWQFRADQRANLRLHPDVLGLTEVTHRHRALVQLAHRYGYRLWQPRQGNSQRVSVALLTRADHPVLNRGWVPVIYGQASPPALRHGMRGILWTIIDVNGERVYVSQWHGLTKGHPGTNDPPDRIADNLRLIHRVARHLHRYSSGLDLAFSLADSNIPALRVPGATDYWPGLRGPIVTVLHTIRDQRVTLTRVRRWDRWSDHFALTASYAIRPA